MQQLKSKGEVFTVNTDGTVTRRITSFSDIFANVEERLPPLWQEEWNRNMWEERLRHKRQSKEAEERLCKQRQIAAVAGVVAAVLIFLG